MSGVKRQANSSRSRQSLAALKGQTIGLASERDLVTAQLVLGTAGIDIQDVSTVVVGDRGSDVAKAIEQKRIVAYAASINDTTVLPGAEITVSVNVFVAVSGAGVVESETPTAKVKLPAAVIPDNSPVLGDNAIPFGGAPLTTDHAYGGIAPLAVRVWLYDSPIVAGGNGPPITNGGPIGVGT
jgi:hypothetical protein